MYVSNIFSRYCRLVIMVFSTMMLTACFDAKPQEYVVKQPVSRVYTVLSALDLSGSDMGSYAEAVNTISVKRASNQSIVYRFKSEAAEQGATIAFQLRGSNDGSATKVFVTYDIPTIAVGDGKKFGKKSGMNYVVPALVRSGFKRELKSLFKALEANQGYNEEARELNLAFHAVSLVVNPTKLQQLMDGDADMLQSFASAYGNGSDNYGSRDYAGSASNIDSATKGGWATDDAKPMSDAKPTLDTENSRTW